MSLVPLTKRDVARRNKLIGQSDDNTLVKQVRETHTSESHHVDVRPVLAVVENILLLASPGKDTLIQGTTEVAYTLEDKIISAASFGDDLLDGLSNVIHKISSEIFCKCSGGDAHSSTMAIFKMLSNYPWEAKVVLALAGFSTTYGEFWLVAQLCATSPLAKSVAHLKQVSEVIENSQEVKPQIDAINSLVGAVLDVTRRIVEFNELPTEYLSQDSEQVSVARAHIPAAAYWTVRSIVACAGHIASLTEFRHGYGGSASEMWELSSFAHKLINIRDLLATELDTCLKYIAEKRYEEEYKTLIRLIESTQLDNMKILRALISTREEKPLLFGTQKTMVSIETLRRKHVLLLISDVDVSHEEILVLYNMYEMRLKQESHYDHQAKETPYEIVWIPVVDRVKEWNDDQQRKFSDLLDLMPWHAVPNPKTVEPHVVRYIRERWNFDKKMLIVALDPLGKVSSTNAMHMMWIWGNSAFPFSHEKEESLWSTENWTLKLVIDGIDQNILQWVTDEKYVCLYGGDDIEWIREFTTRARAMADFLKIPMEMVYVGKSNVPKERLNRIKTVIETEKLSRYWPDPTSVWFFWSRIDSMRCSKAQYGKTIDNDPVLKETMVMLSYDGGEHGWTSVWLGTSKMARANGQLAILTLREFEQWRTEADQVGLLPALEVELKRRHTPQHCTRLILPGIGKDIPQKVVCTECGREMEKFFMFRCCAD